MRIYPDDIPSLHKQHYYSKNDITLDTIADTLADTTAIQHNLEFLAYDSKPAKLIAEHYTALVDTQRADERRNITRGILKAHGHTLTSLLQKYRRPEGRGFATYFTRANMPVVYYNLPLIVAWIIDRRDGFPIHFG